MPETTGRQLATCSENREAANPRLVPTGTIAARWLNATIRLIPRTITATVSSCANRGMRDCVQHEARRQETRQGTEHHIRGRHRLPGGRHSRRRRHHHHHHHSCACPSGHRSDHRNKHRGGRRDHGPGAIRHTPLPSTQLPQEHTRVEGRGGGSARRHRSRLRLRSPPRTRITAFAAPHSRGQTGSVSLQPVRAREPTHKHMAGLRLEAARAVWTADRPWAQRPWRKSSHALDRPPPPMPTSWSTASSREAVAASIPLNH